MSESAASAGAIRASIDFDAAGLEAAVNKAMRRATGQIEQSIDRSMNDVQNTMRSGFRKVGAGIVGFLGLEDVVGTLRRVGGFVLNIGRETEEALNQFGAVSGATSAEMEAMTELAKAGFTVDESMEAAKGTLQLATAAQIDAGAAAEISSKQLQAFGLEVSQAGHVADILANAANATSADMQGMADSLNQVGAVAHSSGLSFTETSAAVALMADNAIVGSDAGTSLKAMLLALQAPSGVAANIMDELGIKVYDNQGHMKSLAEITGVLTHATKDLTDQERQSALAKIFGADAIRAVNVLMNQGKDGMEDMSAALEKEGAAAKLAAANSKGLAGALGALQSTAETVAIDVYDKLAPALDEFVRGGLDALPGVLDDASTYLDALGEGLAPVGHLIADFVAAAEPGAVIAFKAALAAVLGVVRVLGAVLEPVVSLIEHNEDAFRSIVSAVVAATIAYKVLSATVSKAQAIYKSPAIGQATSQVRSLGTSLRSASTVAAGFRSAVTGASAALGGPWGVAMAGAAIGVGIFASQQASAKARVDQLTESLDEQTGALTDNTRQTIARQLLDEGWNDKELAEYGTTLDEVTNAIMHGGDEMERLQEKVDAGFDVRFDTQAFYSSLDGGQQLADVMQRVSEETAQAQENARSLSNVQDGTNTKMLEGAAALKSLLDPTAIASRAQQDMASGAARAGTQLDQEAGAAHRATSAIKGLRDEAISGIEAQISLEEASDNLRGVIRDLSPAAIKSGKALDVNFEAGRNVYRAFIDLARSTEGVQGGMARAREQIYNTIRPMVGSKAEAERLTAQFFDLRDAANQVPNEVNIRVTANVASAVASLTSVIPVVNNVTAMISAATNAAADFKSHHRKGHAGGGAIYGTGTGTSDSLLRRLSNGEHVFTAKEVRAAGGQDAIYAMRAALRRGGLPAVAEMAGGGGGSLVDHLSLSVGSKDDVPEVLGEAMFHLRRIRRGSRYP